MPTDSCSCQQHKKMPGLGGRMLKDTVIFMVIIFGVTGADDRLTSSDHVNTQIEPPENIPSKSRPYIQSPASHLEVLVGKTVEFPCKVHDLGHFVLTWKRGRTGILFSGTIRVDRDERFSLVNGTSLRIYSVTPEFSGAYVCQVWTQPPIELYHNLKVLVPPSIISVPADGMVVVKKDESVHLNCSAAGDPKPVITWRAAKGNLPGGITEKQGNTLIIPSAESFHSGLYECRAENGVGNPATQTFKVEVLYEPHVSVSPTWVHFGKGTTAEFNCTVSAEPASVVYWSHLNGSILQSDNVHVFITSIPNLSILQIKWTDGEESFGSYVCYANNTIGFDSKTVEISGLAEPVIFKTNPIGSENSSFFLKWSIKSYSPIIEYQLSVRTLEEPMGSPGEWIPVMIPVMTQQNILHSQSYNITGLTPGKGYEVVIQARNDWGWNYPSNSFIFYTHGKVQQNEKDETESNTTMSDLQSSSLEEKTGELEEKVNTSNGALKQTFPKYIIPFMFIFSLTFLLL